MQVGYPGDWKATDAVTCEGKAAHIVAVSERFPIPVGGIPILYDNETDNKITIVPISSIKRR